MLSAETAFLVKMPQTKEQKKKIIEKLRENVAKQRAMVFVAIEGLKAAKTFDLRKQLKEADCLLQVAKKTLLNLVFKEKKFDFDAKKLEGQPALIFGFKDEIAPAKIAHNFSKENENLKILGGFFEDKFRNREEIIALAEIPSKEQLLSKVVSSIFSPVSNFVNILQGNIRNFVYLLSIIKK
ncbi:MAG: 50S ribosomal protein L10 [Candidatus Nealsonbacteria bacterium CG10_big_fil_rev_8_21_14_0_10_36_24]|uniref:Large ribosomal subunit protein uL10 n=2 Tax=Candidatus Nealsoniibacteriota TaxID=1817911 RepID=A0A2M6NSD2_9BACT|nr:MAG: 50S ribosomal protein L10 [Candidatus Nealsonbacteria bacterium CG10_big_fil_rev_8_21_14_0_10_36_24]